jgi:hypothetical protein
MPMLAMFIVMLPVFVSRTDSGAPATLTTPSAKDSEEGDSETMGLEIAIPARETTVGLPGEWLVIVIVPPLSPLAFGA